MTRAKGGMPKRTPGKRDPVRVIRVLTEGAVTEPCYLAEWNRRNRDIHIDFAGYGMDPLSLVRRAREHQKHNRQSGTGPRKTKFDEIWCVFDVDEHANLCQALLEARQNGIKITLSNPCFELWPVLHHEDQTAPIHRHDIQKRAEDLGIIKSKDSKHLVAGQLTHHLNEYTAAKRRAQALTQRHTDNESDPISNPSSDVWKLVEKLR